MTSPNTRPRSDPKLALDDTSPAAASSILNERTSSPFTVRDPRNPTKEISNKPTDSAPMTAHPTETGSIASGDSLASLFYESTDSRALSRPKIYKRKLATFVEPKSTAVEKESPAKKNKTVAKEPPAKKNKTVDKQAPANKNKAVAGYLSRAASEVRPSRGKWLQRTLERSTAGTRPKPIVCPQTTKIAQKVSIGATIATPWDPFANRKLVEDTTKLSSKLDAAKEDSDNQDPQSSRFKSWKDPDDDSVTWKVFPKSTPRMKHRGGNIVVDTLVRHPHLHTDIEIKEYEEDSKYWIVRVEDLSVEALAGRRADLVKRARAERRQKGKQAAVRTKAKKEKTDPPPKKYMQQKAKTDLPPKKDMQNKGRRKRIIRWMIKAQEMDSLRLSVEDESIQIARQKDTCIRKLREEASAHAIMVHHDCLLIAI